MANPLELELVDFVHSAGRRYNQKYPSEMRYTLKKQNRMCRETIKNAPKTRRYKVITAGENTTAPFRIHAVETVDGKKLYKPSCYYTNPRFTRIARKTPGLDLAYSTAIKYAWIVDNMEEYTGNEFEPHDNTKFTDYKIDSWQWYALEVYSLQNLKKEFEEFMTRQNDTE